MAQRKLDNRIRILIENCIITQHRSLFIILGKKGRVQVALLHQILNKASIKPKVNVLWCHKKELGFSMLKKKKMKELKKKLQSGTENMNEEDPFEVFMASTKVRFCHYGETQRVLGQTFGMLILQDFEALTPNLLARTVETVEGGGIIVILLPSVKSPKQLYTMPMVIHTRYRTEAHQNVTCRFNERFVLSLLSCPDCLILDDKLDILPVSSNARNTKPLQPKNKDDPKSEAEQELSELQESFQDTQPIGALLSQCKTLDQAKALLKFIDALSEKTLRSTVALTSGRGRGKSATLGLCVASAIAFNYSNIFVTSPSPENLNTFFSFLFKGFDVLSYKDHVDYEVIQSVNPEFNNAVVRVNVFRDHRQTVQYIHPTDADKLGQAELVIIDEAAAIPLPYVKSLLGPHSVFMASTVNGYEGTGRSLSLKLINQLRQQASAVGQTSSVQSCIPPMGRSLHEVTLSESIRYQSGDNVEEWLNRLLCLDASVVPKLHSGCPEPRQCELYYISRDALFSYQKHYEAFLQRIVALFVSSHYKNSPNDLHMMADAPAHHLFCLLPPFETNSKALPEVLCAIQVCVEGRISKDSVLKGLSRGKQAAGDLIPWTVSQQFQDQDFPSLSGARIVRIATHPDYQRMGYGLHALQLLQEYYEGKVPTIDEMPDQVLKGSTVEEESANLSEKFLQPKKSVPPLLLKLTQRPPEALDYIGVSYGLTGELLRFWKKSGFVPVYLRQTANDLTGEHSCIMLKALDTEFGSSHWLPGFFADFRERYLSLLGYQFSKFLPSVALSILTNPTVQSVCARELTKEELGLHLSAYSIKRLEMYCQNLADYHLIVDLIPTLARLYFLNRLGEVSLTFAQTAILLCMGLQHKPVDQIVSELELTSSQILGLFNRAVRRLTQRITGIIEKAVEKTLLAPRSINMEPVEQTLEQELKEAAKEIEAKQKMEAKKLQDMDFSEYAIKGSEEEWQKAVAAAQKTLVSIKRIGKSGDSSEQISYKRNKKHQGNKINYKKRKMQN